MPPVSLQHHTSNKLHVHSINASPSYSYHCPSETSSLINSPVDGRSQYHLTESPPALSPHVASDLRIHRSVPNSRFQIAEYGPTPQQLAARQVVSKELPSFSGDPVDWPLFYSSYQHSSQVCGYSDSENLLRLQRSLKGSAKESVSSFLLHPATVPQVISTLQTLFGRPEHIVHQMVTKVRSIPAPRADRLETLVGFGLAVQNLCGHLKAIGLDQHLSNPMLLQELVDKLPANVKLSWALHQQQASVVDLEEFSEYMGNIVSATSSVTRFNSTPHQKPPREFRSKDNEKAYINAHTMSNEEQDEEDERLGDGASN